MSTADGEAGQILPMGAVCRQEWDKLTYDWCIENVSTHKEEIRSLCITNSLRLKPTFCISFNPSHNVQGVTYCPIYLVRLVGQGKYNDKIDCDFHCTIFDDDGVEIAQKRERLCDFDTTFGFLTILPRHVLLGSITVVDRIRLRIVIISTLPYLNKVCSRLCYNPAQGAKDIMSRMYLDNETKDFTLEVVDGEIRIHSAVVIASSKVLGQLITQSHHLGNSRLPLPLTMSIASSLVQFIYTGQVGVVSVETIKELLALSKTFEMLALKNYLPDILVEKVTCENVFSIIEIAHSCKFQDLKQFCCNFIRAHKNSLDIFGKLRDIYTRDSALTEDILSSLIK